MKEITSRVIIRVGSKSVRTPPRQEKGLKGSETERARPVAEVASSLVSYHSLFSSRFLEDLFGKESGISLFVLGFT